MTFPPYPAYKDSGVEWLGKVPEHWCIKRLKYGLKRMIAGPFGSSLTKDMYTTSGYRVYGQEQVIPDDFSIGDYFISAEKFAEMQRYSVAPGNVLISLVGTFGKVAVVPQSIQPGIINPRLALLEPEVQAVKPEFLGLILTSHVAHSQMNEASRGGTMDIINLSLLAELSLPLPPLAEQRAIAAFLDAETARIDALIARKGALVAALREKRRALISHAVTKGLDPAAPMRDSGVPWLGAVPASWEVKPIKYLVKMESGGTPDKSKLEYWDGDVPWASAKDLKVDLLQDTEDHITQYAIESGAASLVAAESVIIVVRGMILLHTLPVTVNLVPLAINQDLKALHPHGNLEARFLAWVLRGLSDAFLARTDTAGHGTKALRTEDWSDIELGVPPLDEQLAITAYIDRKTAQIDTLIARAQQFIELLREHRTALVAAAVTGRIDVRGV